MLDTVPSCFRYCGPPASIIVIQDVQGGDLDALGDLGELPGPQLLAPYAYKEGPPHFIFPHAYSRVHSNEGCRRPRYAGSSVAMSADLNIDTTPPQVKRPELSPSSTLYTLPITTHDLNVNRSTSCPNENDIENGSDAPTSEGDTLPFSVFTKREKWTLIFIGSMASLFRYVDIPLHIARLMFSVPLVRWLPTYTSQLFRCWRTTLTSRSR